VQYDHARALLEKRKELFFLRFSDRLRHVVENDHIVTKQVVPLVGIRVFSVFGFGKRDLGIVREHPEERFAVKAVATGNNEHLELWIFRCGKGGRGHEQHENESLHIIQ